MPFKNECEFFKKRPRRLKKIYRKIETWYPLENIFALASLRNYTQYLCQYKKNVNSSLNLQKLGSFLISGAAKDTTAATPCYKTRKNRGVNLTTGGISSGSVKILTLSTKKPASKHLGLRLKDLDLNLL
jgi:hypothetical protein